MESSLSQSFFDLRSQVLQLEGRLNLLLNWISYKFAEDTSLPEEFLCSTSNAGLAADCGEELMKDKVDNSSDLLRKDGCTTQLSGTTHRPDHRRRREQKISTLTDQDKVDSSSDPLRKDGCTTQLSGTSLRPDRRGRKQKISTLTDFDFEKVPLDAVKDEAPNETGLIRIVDMRNILNPTEVRLPHSLPRTRQAFVCTVCSRGFRSSALLENHKMTHCFVRLTSLDSREAKPSQPRDPKEPIESTSSLPSDLDDPDFDLQLTENDTELVDCNSSDDGDSSVPLPRRKAQRYDASKASNIEIRRSRVKPDEGDFICCVCQRKFAKERYMRAHMILHHRRIYQEQVMESKVPGKRAMRNSGDFSCSICQQRFVRNRYLMVHMRIRHRETYLQQLASQNKPLIPRAKPNVGDFVCSVCQKKFARERYLRDHTRLLHRELYQEELEKRRMSKPVSNRAPLPRAKRNMGDFDCTVCPKKFAQEQYLRCHMRLQHREIYRQQLLSQNKVLETRAKKNAGDFVCTVCQRKYAQERYLRDHMRQRHLDLYEQQLEERRQSKVTIKYPCSICQEILNSKYSFQQHRMNFHPEHLTANELNRPDTSTRDDLKCDICLDGKQYKSPRYLRKHIKEVHPIQYKCEECNTTFVSFGGLEHHNMAVHLKLKPYVCDICGNSFSKNGGLKIHQQIHSEMRQFSCAYCPKFFRQKAGLDIHLKRHFKSKYQAQCFQCGQLFASSTTLKNHRVRVHEGLRPYGCTKCSKRFKAKTHLNYHLKTHDNPNGRTRGLNKEREPIVRRQPESQKVIEIPEGLITPDPISMVTDTNISSHQLPSCSEAVSEPLEFNIPVPDHFPIEVFEEADIQEWV